MKVIEVLHKKEKALFNAFEKNYVYLGASSRP